MDELHSLWNYLKERFKDSLSKVSYDTWIESANPIRVTDQHLIVEVPSSLHKEYWENNLTTRIVENIYEFSGQELSPIFVIKNEEEAIAAQKKSPSSAMEQKNPFKKNAFLNDKYTLF